MSETADNLEKLVSRGYEHGFVHAAADFLKGLETGEPASPTFEEALATERVCDAILRSARARSWQATGLGGTA